MKNKFRNKAASSVNIIEGADGPTSVFIVENSSSKQTLRQKIHKFLYDMRKKRIIGSLKANPHSMEQVADYIITELGFSETDKSTPEYNSEYSQLRASFIMQYKPELLGDLADIPQPENYEEESIKLVLAQIEQIQKAAENIPPDIFDIDLHIYEKNDRNLQAKIIVEMNYGYIGGSAIGSLKRFGRIFRKVYKYYGVTQDDIGNNTKRYTELIKTLSRR